MKSARKKPTAAKLRSWRVSIIRKRGQYLGTVEARNEKAAEAAAAAEFELSDEQQRRLVVQERNERGRRGQGDRVSAACGSPSRDGGC
jgi:nitroreductase